MMWLFIATANEMEMNTKEKQKVKISHNSHFNTQHKLTQSLSLSHTYNNQHDNWVLYEILSNGGLDISLLFIFRSLSSFMIFHSVDSYNSLNLELQHFRIITLWWRYTNGWSLISQMHSKLCPCLRLFCKVLVVLLFHSGWTIPWNLSWPSFFLLLKTRFFS